MIIDRQQYYDVYNAKHLEALERYRIKKWSSLSDNRIQYLEEVRGSCEYDYGICGVCLARLYVEGDVSPVF